jgi:hypothetical protein
MTTAQHARPVRDHCSRAAAEDDCRHIKAYWIGQGYRAEDIVVWIVGGTCPEGYGGTRRSFCGVRSNLLNGKPRG